MEDRALDHPLEAGGRRGIGLVAGLERFVLLIEVLLHHVAEVAQIDAAGAHHLGRVGIIDQREQQVLERRVLMAAVRRVGEGGVERLLERLSETGHGRDFPARASTTLQCKV